MLSLSHHQLPAPLERIFSLVLLESVPHADFYLGICCVALTALTFLQLKAFARPPPVPRKKLPKRPAISLLFKPDDFKATTRTTTAKPAKASETAPGVTSAYSETTGSLSQPSAWRRNPLKSVTQSLFRNNGGGSQKKQQVQPETIGDVTEKASDSVAADDDAGSGRFSVRSGLTPPIEDDLLTDTSTIPPEKPALSAQDLPDSFAPLLSSSQLEILREHLTANLIHAVHVEGGVRIREGRHEIPLDKDTSRPQLRLDIPKGGCRLSLLARVGSDGFSYQQDLDVDKPTMSRSLPMVKTAGLALDPPLPLTNVAPTLIHFPTLFEDKFVTHDLRRIQIVRLAMDFVVSISSFIEKILWIIESHCQIHLSKVRVTPVYKGRSSDDTDSPEWRLTLAFSGHLMLFNWIPFPFISVILPTFIIPQPHALLEYLLTPEPLASARLRRENIAEQKIALAIIDTAETWNVDTKLLVTPPAVGVDVTLPGGVAVAVEMIYGRDATAGWHRGDGGLMRDAPMRDRSMREVSTRDRSLHGGQKVKVNKPDDHSVNSMSSWSTPPHSTASARLRGTGTGAVPTKTFDANELVPWFCEVSAKGSVSREKMTFHLLKLSASHEDTSVSIPMTSKLGSRGSLAVWRADPKNRQESTPNILRRKGASFGHLAALATEEEIPTIASVLLYPDETIHPGLRMLNYDYAFEVFDDTRLDSMTVSMGANHSMLNGGTMVTTILESIYAFGSISARQNAILDPLDWRQKRNVLRHLPAVDFTFGVQNIHIPPESMSFSSDGKDFVCLPEMEGGRMMIRLLGGTEEGAKLTRSVPKEVTMSGNIGSSKVSDIPVSEGVKVIAEFGISSLVLDNEAHVKEFPELDIFEGAKLKSLISGIISGSIITHLRPQKLEYGSSSAGPNIFNPLEAYEIDFSGSSLSLKIKECSGNLGHRRVIIPTETTVMIQILESVVDMTLEGMTQCELCWDFQGSSPILQVAKVGQCPADVGPESKEQISFLIPPLRQGRFTLHVSSVGGINIAKAATSREDKEGLYDWKFFNAIVSPDDTSGDRLLQVINDKRTMEKLLQVAKLINSDVHRILRFVLTHVWRAKEIFDDEGISDPKHIIPGRRMARLISLLLCGDASETDKLLSIIQRVVRGDGLDIVKVKELLRQYVEAYDEWAPEIDRAVRWAAVAFGPMAVDPPYVEAKVPPLSEMLHHVRRLKDIPSAKELYDKIHDKPHLPLEPAFSNLLSRVAPYLTFQQIEYFLQVRSSQDWQPSDLKRIRYVYSIKRRVLEIAESYGGLSFLPQSFLVSVFLGEATRASLRASTRKVGGRQRKHHHHHHHHDHRASDKNQRPYSTLSTLRRRRSSIRQRQLDHIAEDSNDDFVLTPAGRVASKVNLREGLLEESTIPEVIVEQGSNTPSKMHDQFMLDAATTPGSYELGDSLLGPQDVAILLQAGLTSAMKGSTVVQLNQRMLLDLMASQPNSFAIAVLAEIGTHGGQGSPRGLTSALMALLELDQTSFKPVYRLDMHALLETWLPELKIPKREDYMAGGRWARQSYYEAVYAVSTSIIEDAECYIALKGHIQKYRRHKESDPLPHPRVDPRFDPRGRDSGELSSTDNTGIVMDESEWHKPKLQECVDVAKQAILAADSAGETFVKEQLLRNEKSAKASSSYNTVIQLYRDAFDACAKVLALDKIAFHSDWFRDFYKRNYDALMIKSMLDNVINDVDRVRYWLQTIRIGAKRADLMAKRANSNDPPDEGFNFFGIQIGGENFEEILESLKSDKMFLEPERSSEQELLDAILDAIIFQVEDRERLRKDPLMRLLIPNPTGQYNFAIVTAMGVITEGKQGSELETALERLKKQRGVQTIRADTGTARSFDYNASKIVDAIETVVKMKKPYGLIGYSQGCANALWAESMLLSGSPVQRQFLENEYGGLVCRQLLFSAANGSVHGPSLDKKVQRLIVMCEEFFKYQQGYASRALASTVLEALNGAMDSAPFQKMLGGAQTFLNEGCRAFWREAQHLPHVPTCTLRGVMEPHTTPECLEMLGNLLAKQSGSSLHDSQVHVYDAVGYPVYHNNRNGNLLKKCAVGDGAIQRTHHWSPLCNEVEFVNTHKDIEQASFDCAKDRHVFPWVDVNVRFGFIHYVDNESNWEETDSVSAVIKTPLSTEQHPSKLTQQLLDSKNNE